MTRLVDKAIDYMTDRNHHASPLIAVLGVIGLRRVARLASLGLAALWVVDQMRAIDRNRGIGRSNSKDDDLIDTAMEESFPASDPPSYSPTTSGAPDEAPVIARLRTVH